jgi:hypothetical protein
MNFTGNQEHSFTGGTGGIFLAISRSKNYEHILKKIPPDLIALL